VTFGGELTALLPPGKFEFLEDLKFWMALTTNSDFYVNLSSVKLQILNSLGMLLWLDLPHRVQNSIRNHLSLQKLFLNVRKIVLKIDFLTIF